MSKLKNYLKTFEPSGFTNSVRLVGSILFIATLYSLFFISYFSIGEITGFPLFVNLYYLIPLCISISVLIFLSIDFTAGFGRNYMNKGTKNLLVFLPVWTLFVILHYLLIINL